MNAKLDKTLDELAAESRKENRRGRRGRRGFSGRRGLRGRRRTGGNRNTSNNETDNRRRLHITNLNTSLNNEELKKLFQQYGTLTRCGIHFDKMGVSKGTADIEFQNHEDAEKARSNLNQAEINGVTVSVLYSNRPIRRRNSTNGANRTSRKIGLRRRGRTGGLRRRNQGGLRNNRRNNNGRRRSNNNAGGNNRRRLFRNSLGRRRRN